MTRFMQVLISGLLTFGSTFASAAETDAHRPLKAETKVAKADQTVKSNKRKSGPSKTDPQYFPESRAEDDSPLSRKEIEEMREALGEK